VTQQIEKDNPEDPIADAVVVVAIARRYKADAASRSANESAFESHGRAIRDHFE
jgi:hypothetical protein